MNLFCEILNARVPTGDDVSKSCCFEFLWFYKYFAHLLFPTLTCNVYIGLIVHHHVVYYNVNPDFSIFFDLRTHYTQVHTDTYAVYYIRAALFTRILPSIRRFYYDIIFFIFKNHFMIIFILILTTRFIKYFRFVWWIFVPIYFLYMYNFNIMKNTYIYSKLLV